MYRMFMPKIDTKDHLLQYLQILKDYYVYVRMILHSWEDACQRRYVMIVADLDVVGFSPSYIVSLLDLLALK